MANRPTLPHVLLPTFLAVLCLALPLGTVSGDDVPEIEFFPPDTGQWGIRNIGAGVTSVLGLWGYWYSNLKTVVETVPSDATVELFYIRANFQKNFTRVSPPIRVILPPRIKTTPKDALTIRVASPGYKGREITFDVEDIPKKILLELAPLPNSLTFLGHTHLARRTTLTLRTTKEPQFRVIQSRDVPGFTLALTETADQVDGDAKLSGGQVESVEVAQVGEDLLLKVNTQTKDVDVRSKTRYDPIRKEHIFLLDLVPKGARAPSFDQVRKQLERVSFPAAGPCRDSYETEIRDSLDPEAVARAHRASGSIADLYRRETMKRVGRIERGTVHTTTGETLRTGNPLELELAMQSAGNVEGYIAFLGALARSQPDPPLALRSLLAPEQSAEEFEPIYRKAEATRGSCS